MGLFGWGSHLSCSQLAILPALAVVLCHIQALVDAARDGLYLSPQLLFDALQVKAVVVGDQVDGQTQVSKTAWSVRDDNVKGQIIKRLFQTRAQAKVHEGQITNHCDVCGEISRATVSDLHLNNFIVVIL